MVKQRKKDKPLRKRHEIKREQIKRREFIRKIKYITILIIILIFVVFAVILFSYYTEQEKNGDNGTHNDTNGNNIGIEVGQTAPDFELRDTENNEFTLGDFRGNVVVLDFMAIWCGPCEEELEHLKETDSNYDNSAVSIVSIDVDNSESSNQLKDYKFDHSCDWIFAAGGGGVGDTYNIGSIPTIYIIDKQGIISYKNVGLTDYSILQSEIEKLL